jgi:hypothetical protein
MAVLAASLAMVAEEKHQMKLHFKRSRAAYKAETQQKAKQARFLSYEGDICRHLWAGGAASREDID